MAPTARGLPLKANLWPTSIEKVITGRGCPDRLVGPVPGANGRPYTFSHVLRFDQWSEATFLVASAVYADASGNDHDTPLCLIGGWYNSASNWSAFATEWKPFLLKHDIPYLHQTKSKDPRADQWKGKPRWDAIRDEAIDIIERSGAISTAYWTLSADFSAHMQERMQRGYSQRECFAFNGFGFIANVQRACMDRRVSMPEFVFESSGKPEQDALRNALTGTGLPEPIFRSKTETDPERAVVALQAADFLAYELFRGWKSIMNSDPTDRPFLRRFEKMVPHEWGHSTREMLDRLIDRTEIQLELERIAEEARHQ
jgi:hypothetical protein